MLLPMNDSFHAFTVNLTGAHRISMPKRHVPDDSTEAAAVRRSWERCRQCHRCHDPCRRCRCSSCGLIHLSVDPCAIVDGAQERCDTCNLIHEPGPCIPNFGPVAVACGQCGRSHLPGNRCKCRNCGMLHNAATACVIEHEPVIQDVYEGAAFSRRPVAAYDGGSPMDACPHCDALFFKDEGLYVNCCRRGTVRVASQHVPPDLFSVITDSHVHLHIRQYNAAVAMASVGYSGDAMGRVNAVAPGRPHVDGYGNACMML